MLIEHDGKCPRIAASAYIAPTAVVCGDVTIGEDSRILFNAVVAAEGPSRDRRPLHRDGARERPRTG
jgi:carbonic anhydrase/acetyltransferase-like protein (isoleucine patch superfamily)